MKTHGQYRNNLRSTHGPLTPGYKKVIFASSLGTVFEWSDLYLYGSLAVFSALNPTSGFIFALLAFVAGLAARSARSSWDQSVSHEEGPS